MNFIVAVDENYNIGNDNSLLVHLPDDLKNFKNITTGKVVVMGRKTLDSLPKSEPLPNRINIVLTRDNNFKKENCIVVTSIDDLFECIKGYNHEDVFIIGGAEIYNSLIPYCEYGYITKIKEKYIANKKIDDIEKLGNWNKIWESDEMEHNNTKYVFTKYKSNNVKTMPRRKTMELSKEALLQEIARLKKEKNAVIVAHYYQIDEVQEIADMVGDSFALSKYCATTDADTIVFCGVSFMAESAKILSPEKTVLLPKATAGCPMADMITADDVRELKEMHPNAAVVCYVNSSAETKAECDVCCTSSNALKIVNSLEEKDIIFIPDKNLGSYVAKQVPDKNIILFDGYCYTHNKITVDDLEQVRKAHPDAILAIHPECPKEVVEKADFVGSTSEIINYCTKSNERKFIIGTEMGILYELKNKNKDKEFYLLTPRFVCPNMKKTTIESVFEALKNNINETFVDEDIRIKAKKSLERMLELAK